MGWWLALLISAGYVVTAAAIGVALIALFLCVFWLPGWLLGQLDHGPEADPKPRASGRWTWDAAPQVVALIITAAMVLAALALG